MRKTEKIHWVQDPATPVRFLCIFITLTIAITVSSLFVSSNISKFFYNILPIVFMAISLLPIWVFIALGTDKNAGFIGFATFSPILFSMAVAVGCVQKIAYPVIEAGFSNENKVLVSIISTVIMGGLYYVILYLAFLLGRKWS